LVLILIKCDVNCCEINSLWQNGCFWANIKFQILDVLILQSFTNKFRNFNSIQAIASVWKVHIFTNMKMSYWPVMLSNLRYSVTYKVICLCICSLVRWFQGERCSWSFPASYGTVAATEQHWGEHILPHESISTTRIEQLRRF